MGFADWLAEKLMTPEQRAEARATVVTVAFCELSDPVPEYDGSGYSYVWPFDVEPAVGDRVIVPGSRGPSTAVVIFCGRSPRSVGMSLKPVLELVGEDELDDVSEQQTAALCAWLDMARVKAGLPVDGPVPDAVPEGFSEVPPVKGRASAAKAREYGNGWWWAFKRAEELDRDDEEIDAFEDIARDWYYRAEELEADG